MKTECANSVAQDTAFSCCVIATKGSDSPRLQNHTWCNYKRTELRK